MLQDFEALRPNLLARTIETVQGGGMVCILLKTMSSLKQLYTLTMVLVLRSKILIAGCSRSISYRCVQRCCSSIQRTLFTLSWDLFNMSCCRRRTKRDSHLRCSGHQTPSACCGRCRKAPSQRTETLPIRIHRPETTRPSRGSSQNSGPGKSGSHLC